MALSSGRAPGQTKRRHRRKRKSKNAGSGMQSVPSSSRDSSSSSAGSRDDRIEAVASAMAALPAPSHSVTSSSTSNSNNYDSNNSSISSNSGAGTTRQGVQAGLPLDSSNYVEVQGTRLVHKPHLHVSASIPQEGAYVDESDILAGEDTLAVPGTRMKRSTSSASGDAVGEGIFDGESEPWRRTSNPGSGIFRDWNDEYQALDSIDLNSRFAATHRMAVLGREFLETAFTYGKIIISERSLPDSAKTIKPVPFGGVAGGTKFLHCNILFKFALDQQVSAPDGSTRWLYGGKGGPNHERAMKAAGRELLGRDRYFGCWVPGLHFPLTVLIDYKGFRLIAMPLLPISQQVTLRYGSADGGATVHASDPKLNGMMERVAKKLNLAGHVVRGARTGNEVIIHGPGDVEGHKGFDNRYYVLDFARAFAPEAPPSALAAYTAKRSQEIAEEEGNLWEQSASASTLSGGDAESSRSVSGAAGETTSESRKTSVSGSLSNRLGSYSDSNGVPLPDTLVTASSSLVDVGFSGSLTASGPAVSAFPGTPVSGSSQYRVPDSVEASPALSSSSERKASGNGGETLGTLRKPYPPRVASYVNTLGSSDPFGDSFSDGDEDAYLTTPDDLGAGASSNSTGDGIGMGLSGMSGSTLNGSIPGSASGTTLARYLRPEYTRQYKDPLCADTFLKWDFASKEQAISNRRKVCEATLHLYDEVIPKFAESLDARFEIMADKYDFQPDSPSCDAPMGMGLAPSTVSTGSSNAPTMSSSLSGSTSTMDAQPGASAPWSGMSAPSTGTQEEADIGYNMTSSSSSIGGRRESALGGMDPPFAGWIAVLEEERALLRSTGSSARSSAMREDHDEDTYQFKLRVMLDIIASSTLHKAGISVHHLGRVRSCVRHDGLRQLILVDCTARVLRRNLEARFRDLMDQVAIPSDEPFKHLAVRFLNEVFTTSDVDSPPALLFWSQTIKADLSNRFEHILTPEEADPLYDLRDSLCLKAVFVSLARKAGIRLSTEAANDLMKSLGATFRFVQADVVEVLSKYRMPYMWYANEGLNYFHEGCAHAKSGYVRPARRAFLAAVEAFNSCLEGATEGGFPLILLGMTYAHIAMLRSEASGFCRVWEVAESYFVRAHDIWPIDALYILWAAVARRSAQLFPSIATELGHIAAGKEAIIPEARVGPEELKRLLAMSLDETMCAYAPQGQSPATVLRQPFKANSA